MRGVFSTPARTSSHPTADTRRLADLDEGAILAEIFALLPRVHSPSVLVGPGDDAAVLALAAPTLVATTDTMVLGTEWRDDWSTGFDVGYKSCVQNVADIAAMGAVPTALLVCLVADPDTPMAWLVDFTRGLAEAAERVPVAVVGGDLSSAPPGQRMVTVTALGSLTGPAVLRSGAQAGDVVALCGSLGLAAAGYRLLRDGRSQEHPRAVEHQRRPWCPVLEGPRAAAAGASAMLDVSDGLVKDAGRIAIASGVQIELFSGALDADVEAARPGLSLQQAWEVVLGGGEDHALLATFGDRHAIPTGWRVLGEVRALTPDSRGPVTLDGAVPTVAGWDHFASASDTD